MARSTTALSVESRDCPARRPKQDAARPQVLDGGHGVVALGKAGNVHAAHHHGARPQMVQRIAHVEAVLQRGQHAHLVCCHGAHAHGCAAAAAPDIAPADHHRQFHAGVLDVDEHAGNLFKLFMTEQLAVQPQSLAAEL